MPPLVRGLKGVKTVGVGTFETEAQTPRRFGPVVARMLKDEIENSKTYTFANASALADASAKAPLVLSGKVSCRVAEKTVKLPSGDVKARTAEVSIVLTGTAGKTAKLFTVTEAPAVEDKRRITEQPSELDELGDTLLRICVRRLVADISPQRVRVKIPRPGFMGSARTRAGIDLLATDPARAVDELAAALDRDGDDAAALNALGFCSEAAGNLDAALSSYLYAAAIDSRAEYRENLERVRALIERRKHVTGAGIAPKGQPK